MVGTILPIVYGERKRGKLPVVLWLHFLGCFVGASCLGALLGLIGAVLPKQVMTLGPSISAFVASGFVSLLYSVRELDLIQVPAPQFRRQVPSKWRLLLPPRVTALFYGLELGWGLTIRISVTTFYVAAIWAIMSGSPILGALCMAMFGLGRALPLMWISRGLDSVADCRRLAYTLTGWETVVHFINGLVLAFAGSCFLVNSLILR